MKSNQCVTVCPDGTYGDPVKLKCVPCIYFSYAGNCLLSCPNNTYVNVLNNQTICQNCSVSLGTCKKAYDFQVTTTLINGGNSLQNKVYLSAGL
jgi:hypothetical protein